MFKVATLLSSRATDQKTAIAALHGTALIHHFVVCSYHCSKQQVANNSNINSRPTQLTSITGVGVAIGHAAQVIFTTAKCNRHCPR
jgi:hypothetical protein